MAELGWTAVRVRGLTRGGYREQVRGYCRDAWQGRHTQAPDPERALRRGRERGSSQGGQGVHASR